jgi:2-dehydropantoate 2-reductase
MRIAVIGAGAVGGFFGALLCRAGHEVTFLARGPHLAAIRAGGLAVESVQVGNFTVRAAATDDPAALGSNDFVIVAVKMYDLADVARAAAGALAPDGILLPLQNGLDAPELLAAAAGRERTLIGSASIEATVTAPGTVAHTLPVHWLAMAELAGPASERLRRLSGVLGEAGISVRLADDGRQLLWDKAALLIPFATLTTAAECTLGDIWDLPALKAAWSALRDEATAVAAADGYDVRPSLASYEEAFERMLPKAAGFTSSMSRDFRAGRRNELEWLTGKLVRLAAERQVPVPAHEALYGLLDLKSKRQAAT